MSVVRVLAELTFSCPMVSSINFFDNGLFLQNFHKQGLDQSILQIRPTTFSHHSFVSSGRFAKNSSAPNSHCAGLNIHFCESNQCVGIKPLCSPSQEVSTWAEANTDRKYSLRHWVLNNKDAAFKSSGTKGQSK